MKILVINGTPRAQGQTRVVYQHVVANLQESFPAQTVAGFDLAEARLPLYGYPLSEEEQTLVNDWVAQVAAADAYVVLTPEYHHTISGALKNAFDHLPVRSMSDKFAAVVTVGGRYGGAHAAASAFAMLRGMRVWAVPSPVCIPLEERSAAKSLENPINQDRLTEVFGKLVAVAAAVRG
ncbi:MAG TPA: NAD(P)H-dependent oxidoreductase [Symbiobacteriaceae bacterium]|nr:NAD(P)H-dependent oxidoreductase [Symbiobacteriaceae bacterium]